jgi:hypothetical protein
VVVVAVVVAVSVDVCAVALLNVSEDEERLHVVGLAALEGEVVIEQLSVTVPLNELPGVTVMVEVPLALWATVMLVGLLERLKPVVLLVFGACQKSPQPAISAAAAINPAQSPIFIPAPCAPQSGCALFQNLLTG